MRKNDFKNIGLILGILCWVPFSLSAVVVSTPPSWGGPFILVMPKADLSEHEARAANSAYLQTGLRIKYQGADETLNLIANQFSIASTSYISNTRSFEGYNLPLGSANSSQTLNYISSFNIRNNIANGAPAVPTPAPSVYANPTAGPANESQWQSCAEVEDTDLNSIASGSNQVSQARKIGVVGSILKFTAIFQPSFDPDPPSAQLKYLRNSCQDSATLLKRICEEVSPGVWRPSTVAQSCACASDTLGGYCLANPSTDSSIVVSTAPALNPIMTSGIAPTPTPTPTSTSSKKTRTITVIPILSDPILTSVVEPTPTPVPTPVGMTVCLPVAIDYSGPLTPEQWDYYNSRHYCVGPRPTPTPVPTLYKDTDKSNQPIVMTTDIQDIANGLNPSVGGNIQMCANSQSWCVNPVVVASDQCTSDGTSVIEAYLDTSVVNASPVKTQLISCPYGCANGACKIPSGSTVTSAGLCRTTSSFNSVIDKDLELLSANIRAAESIYVYRLTCTQAPGNPSLCGSAIYTSKDKCNSAGPGIEEWSCSDGVVNQRVFDQASSSPNNCNVCSSSSSGAFCN